MPFTFQFDWKNRILRLRFNGDFTDEALRDFLRVAFQLNFYTQPASALIDTSGVIDVAVTPATIRALAEERPTITNESVPRVVIAPHPKLYELARLFQEEGKSTRPRFHVVRSEKEALAIIGVANPIFQPIEWR